MSTIWKLIDDKKPHPLCVYRTDKADKAMELMAKHEYSHLPVLDKDNKLSGMVTTLSIWKSTKKFQTSPDKLTVLDCMVKPITYSKDTEMFEVLEGLQEHAIAIIVDKDEQVIGIFTDYDAAVYFRSRAENIMLVAEIEVTLRGFIRLAFPNNPPGVPNDIFEKAVSSARNSSRYEEPFKKALVHYLDLKKGDTLDMPRMREAFAVLQGQNEQVSFDRLTLQECIDMWLASERWERYAKVIQLEPVSIRKILEDVRDIRNKIAHFRGDISPSETEALIFCRNWMSAHHPDLLDEFGETEAAIQIQIESQKDPIKSAVDDADTGAAHELETVTTIEEGSNERLDVERVSKYSALKRWLSGVPLTTFTTWINFDKVEYLIGEPLPPSAFSYRSWWANASESHSQSRLWQDAGWETDIVDLEKKRVRFRRIDELPEDTDASYL